MFFINDFLFAIIPGKKVKENIFGGFKVWAIVHRGGKVAGHNASAMRKQRDMNFCVQFAFSSLFCPEAIALRIVLPTLRMNILS